MEKHSNRSSVPLSPYLRGFTVIKFKRQRTEIIIYI